MLICPNKNLKEWKDLAASVGENRAMLMWYESEGKVGFTLSAQTTILDNLSKVNNWFKQMKDTNAFWNKLQKDLQIPKEQISLLKESNGKTIEEKLTNFVVNYSYTVEINTAKQQLPIDDQTRYYQDGNKYYSEDPYDGKQEITFEEYERYRPKLTSNSSYYSNLTVPGGTNYTENEISTPLITPSIKGHGRFSTDNGIGWFRSDDKIKKGTEKEELWYGVASGEDGEIQNSYKTKEEAEKAINELNKNLDEYTPRYFISTKEKYGAEIKQSGESSNTRRILEVQSDLFQKGRYNERLVGERGQLDETYDEALQALKEAVKRGDWTQQEADEEIKRLNKEKGSKENQFLQLLNKDNNWVTFFVKSIIQDSAKKGYEKVLFPTGNTAAKVEGHQTMEDEIIRIDKHIDILNNAKLYPINIPAQKAISTPTKWAPEIPAQILYQLDTKSDPTGYLFNTKEEARESVNNKLKILKKERNRYKEEGIEKLKPIEAFYEIKVGNILEKLFGKDNVKVITDEYGNTWNEVELLDDLLENFTIGSFKPRIPIPVPINNSLEELYKEDVENSNNNCTFDTGK